MGALLSWIQTEMPFSFSASGSSHQKNSFPLGSNLGKLIKGQTLSLSSSDSSSCTSGESQGTNSESFGYVQQPSIISDGSDDGKDPAVKFTFSFCWLTGILSQNPSDSGNGNGISIQPGLVESLMNDLIEFGLCSPG